ncbi:MAG: LuxR C-terminal-related transcriptional regulator [Treponema sp.]|nr:LuxR C-terminal-related transcriptional regulator [Treponema sp.]
MEQTTKKDLLPIEELTKRMSRFSIDYFLVDAHRDRESYYAVFPELFQTIPPTPEQMTSLCTEEKFTCICGLILNLIMDGELDKSQNFMKCFPKEKRFEFLYMGFTIVHPKVTWREFIDIIDYFKKINFQMPGLVVTAGRPSVLNGFNDFSRIGPFLQKNRDLFIEDLSHLYDKSLCPAIYNQCLAEYLYQQNKIMDAELILSRTIQEFNKDTERRLLFAASYLQAKILIAQKKPTHLDSYIKNIRTLVKEIGHAEFSYNINAAEALFAMIEGNTQTVINWFENDAPDEYSDFCMLDSWRYFVKIRFYIIVKNYAAALSLIERMRPLLEQGKRHMDLCELDVLNTIALFRANKKEIAFKALTRSLRIAKHRQYYRIIADEGEAILSILNLYIKEKGFDSFGKQFLTSLLEGARNISVNYPLYLKPIKNELQLTDTEIDILRFMERGKTNDEIADYFFISTNTVKFHLKNIYSKLDVKNATSAIWEARTQGII